MSPESGKAVIVPCLIDSLFLHQRKYGRETNLREIPEWDTAISLYTGSLYQVYRAPPLTGDRYRPAKGEVLTSVYPADTES